MELIALGIGFAFMAYLLYDFFQDLSRANKQLRMALRMRDYQQLETTYVHHDTFSND